MTTSAVASRGNADSVPDPVVLRRNLDEADAGILVAVLAQLSGDPRVVDEFAPKITFEPDPPEQRGVTDATTRSALVEAIMAILSGTTVPTRDFAADDPEFFKKVAPVGLGGAVDDRYIPLLLEQGGFRKSQPALPRTAPVPATMKLAIIGAGMAGMAAALAAADAGISYEIFDRHEEVGGTWFTTVYPGIAVDTPSTYYSLSSELNPDWSNYYPLGPEYQRYLQAVADKHGIREHTRFNTEVEALRWDEDRQEWEIHSRKADGTRDVSRATAVVTAAGYLNRPQFPDLEGRESFKGISIHSAEWEPGLDLKGKRVAILGVGCTAVQIIDAVADDVAHLTVFQRQPHWVAPRRRLSDEVPDYQRYLCRHVPFYSNWVRLKSYWGTADNNYPVVEVDPEWASSHLSISPANDVLLQQCLAYIDKTFGAGTDMAKKMTPDFAPFGKRIVRDPGGYYAALTKPHVELIADTPAKVTSKGIVTKDGREIELDAIIYATGYTLDFLSTMEIIGRDGKELQQEWAGEPKSYRGGTVPGFPNLFITSNPNGSPGHGAGHNFGVEVAVHYIIECLQFLANKGAHSMEPTREAYDDYVGRIDQVMEKTVWKHTPTAHTYYRVPSGRVVIACPLLMIDWWEEHRAPNEDHFVVR